MCANGLAMGASWEGEGAECTSTAGLVDLADAGRAMFVGRALDAQTLAGVAEQPATIPVGGAARRAGQRRAADRRVDGTVSVDQALDAAVGDGLAEPGAAVR